MEYGFLSKAGKFLQEQRKNRRWMMIFLCLAGGVTLGTLGFLKLYGQAMTHKVKVLDCQYEVHVHTEECYEEDEDGSAVLVCEHADEAEYVIHTHNDDCYNAKGELVCLLKEHELHEHDEDCWEEQEVLICGKEEAELTAAENAEDHAEQAEEASEEAAQAEDDSQDEESVQELACEKEAHKHDDSCYADGAGCELEEHSHDDSCYEVTEELTCETETHTHDDSCYGEGETVLDCGEEEHEHEDGCYDEDGELVCEEGEHTHDDGCYTTTEGGLECGLEEHEHGDGCYTTTETLVCAAEEHEHDDNCEAESELTCEIEEHEHDDSCYTETDAEPVKKETSEKKTEESPKKESAEETEDKEEAEEGHVHTDECYETERVLICGELELHTHEEDPDSENCCYDEACYDEEGNFIEGSRPFCGLLQLEEHVHTEECFQIVEMTPEEIAAINGGATLHVHTEECYDEEGNLICGHEVTHLHQLDCYDEEGNLICGFGGEEHQHDANCYDEEGNLTCGHENAKDHQHDANCYDEEGNLTCEYQGVKDHQHTKACYDEEGSLTCGYEGVKDHEHDAGCYDIFGSLTCGYEDAEVHVHTEACYDEEGNLICGYEVMEIFEQSRRFENESYIVVARYNNDAEIPEEAELLVEQITPESDGEHYASRETEYRELLEDETASMKALLKIGFYVEGEDGQTEIEPKSPVALAIQFLDEDGLAEGKPITVIHFAEEGTERLDGSAAKDNSTTFQMDSFSEIAIGYDPEGGVATVATDGILHINGDFECDAAPFHIVFHVEGDAKTADGSPVMIPISGEEDAAASLDGEETDSEDAFVQSEIEVTDGEEDSAQSMTEEEGLQEGTESGEAEEGVESGTPDSIEEAAPVEETAVIEDAVKQKLRFYVKSLDEDQELREALEDYVGESTDTVNRSILQTLSYGMTYEEIELDLSNCTVTAKFTLNTEQAEGDAKDSDTAQESINTAKNTGDTASEGMEADAQGQESAAIVNVTLQNMADETDPEGQETVTAINATVQDAAVADDIAGNPEIIETIKNILADDDAGADEDADNGSDAGTDMEITFMAIGVQSDLQMTKLATMNVNSNMQDTEMDVSVVTNTIAVAAESEYNPTFTVQYYAYAQILEDNELNVPDPDNNAITVIDTSTVAGEWKGYRLPDNDSAAKGTVKTRKMYVKKIGQKEFSGATNGLLGPKDDKIWELYTPIYKDKESVDSLTKLYTADQYQFYDKENGISHDKLSNFNKFAKDGLHYDLAEIWVLEDEEFKDSQTKDGWKVYDGKSVDLNSLVFTNSPGSVGGNVIQIKDGTVIRLVGRSNEDEKLPYPTTFFDYDYSGGTKSNGNADIYMKGINSISNYCNRDIEFDSDKEVKGAVYGFGNNTVNAENQTGLALSKLGKYYINRANTPSDNTIIGKCSYGIVQSSLSSEGYPQFNPNAPKALFDASVPETGKEAFSDYSLVFDRNGDTYTLKSVSGSQNGAIQEAVNLDQFWKVGIGWNSSDWVYTNQFWPMDTASTFGAEGHDPKFGTNALYESLQVPRSDDGQLHNSFFGMNFEVEFELTDDYVGPLNYYFFGDDDMWVFLECQDKNEKLPNGQSSQLICDIGGVHQAAGEYVDLWNYIQKPTDETKKTGTGETKRETKKYKLKFFYTERGASGSTCWMQFTLPSVNAVPAQNPTGNMKNTLTFGKEVEDAVPDRLFDFKITFTGAAVNTGLNKYPYVIERSNGEKESGWIASGERFQLGHKDSITILNLPDETKYVIEEEKYDGYEPGMGEGTTEGVILKDQTVEGTIDWDRDDIVNFINKEVEYNLPETGGPGPIWYILAGAFLITLGAGLMYNKKFSERRV